jgi:hypothetical protein
MHDLLLAFWINAGFAAMFVWFPAKLFAGNWKDQGRGIAVFRRFARMTALTLAGVMGLVSLHVLNAFTLLFFYATLAFVARLYRCHWTLESAVSLPIRRIALAIADLVEFRPPRGSWKGLGRGMRGAAARWVTDLKLPWISVSKALVMLALTMAVGLTILLRFTAPVLELRLGTPSSYQVLLATRQLLVQQIPGHSPVLPSLIAAISLVTGTDPMQVVRFVDPTLGCLLAIAVATVVRSLLMNRIAALAALYGMGVYVFAGSVQKSVGNERLAAFSRTSQQLLTQQWSAGEVALGTLLLLTGFLCLLNQSPHTAKGTALDAVCCVALAALTFLPLLTLVPLFAVALWTRPKFRLPALASGWILLGLGAAVREGAFPFHRIFFVTLPVGLALMVGSLALLVLWLFALLHREYAEAITAALLVLLAVALPAAPVASGESLEYDAAARQALKISREFPRQHWMIAAPVEQLAEVYGIGGHLDLAEFVDEYQARAKDSGFHLSLPVDDLFVFAEKQPFSSSPAAAASVPFKTLVDPTYRNYRSPAGRASLEFATFDLCESYRHSHPATSVYYEDSTLRIYHFRAR